MQIQSADGRPIRLARRKERLALGILLLQLGRVVTTERLIDLLWMETPPPSARTALQTLMSRIRAALRSAADDDPVRLVAQGAGYLLQARPDAVDLYQFRALVEGARTIGDPQARSTCLATALKLWRGPALADAANDAVRAQLCVDLEESRFAAVSDRIDADLGKTWRFSQNLNAAPLPRLSASGWSGLGTGSVAEGGYCSLAKTADYFTAALVEVNENTGSSSSHRSIVFRKFNLPWILNGRTES